MYYQELNWQEYQNLITYSTRITTSLKQLIEINKKEKQDSLDQMERKRLQQEITDTLIREQNLLKKIGYEKDPNTTIKGFLDRLKEEKSISREAQTRLYYRLSEVLNAKQAKNISASELGITDFSWQYQTFTLKEIITAHLGILLINELTPCVVCDIRLFYEPIKFSDEKTKHLYDALKDSILKILTTSPCLELLYALYGNDIEVTLFDQIKSVLKGNTEIEEQFKEFIDATFKTLSPHRNSLGEITFKDEPKDIISLLEKLLLLKILIPQMSDNALKHFKNQLSWGININGEKKEPIYLLYSINEELKKRGLLDSKPFH